jgi:hypothetical protein
MAEVLFTSLAINIRIYPLFKIRSLRLFSDAKEYRVLQIIRGQRAILLIDRPLIIGYIPEALIVRMLILRKVSDTNRKVDNRD